MKLGQPVFLFTSEKKLAIVVALKMGETVPEEIGNLNPVKEFGPGPPLLVSHSHQTNGRGACRTVIISQLLASQSDAHTIAPHRDPIPSIPSIHI